MQASLNGDAGPNQTMIAGRNRFFRNLQLIFLFFMNYSNKLFVPLVAILLAALPGCYFLGKNERIVRIWADYNTLRAPALFVEQMSHRPYDPIRVVREHVLYNKPPDPPPTSPPPAGTITPGMSVEHTVAEHKPGLQVADPILISPPFAPSPPAKNPRSPFDVELLVPPAPDDAE